MNTSKLVEAIVIRNSTPQLQMETFLRNVKNPEKFAVDLAVIVFGLEKRERTIKDLENELTAMFIKRLSMLDLASAVFSGLTDNSGPLEGIKKKVAHRACVKMGYMSPIDLKG